MKIFSQRVAPDQIDVFGRCKEENIVILGWSETGDLSGFNYEKIKEKVSEAYNISGQRLGYACGQINAFVRTVSEGDIFLVKKENIISVGIYKEYVYDTRLDEDRTSSEKQIVVGHKRKVEWIRDLELDTLPLDLQKLVKNRNSIAQYHGQISEELLEFLLKGEEIKKIIKSIRERALEILEENLNSENEEIKLKSLELVFKYNL